MSFELGGKYLADLHGFGKLASAVTILHDAKDPHKPYAFLQHVSVMRPSHHGVILARVRARA